MKKILIIILLTGWLVLPLYAAADDFSFIIVGDTHNMSDTPLIDALSRYPDLALLMSVGDNSPTGNYLGWDGFDERVHKVFGPSFPWFMAPGNHNADSPQDMEHIAVNLMPVFRSHPSISNFSAAVLPYSEIDLLAFEMYNRGATQDKRAEVIAALSGAGVGSSDGSFFTWADPDLSLNQFSNILDTIDFSSCTLSHYSMDTSTEVKNGIKMIYMANKVSPYSFDFGNAHFICLNLYYDNLIAFGHIGDRQMAWLENDLMNNIQPMVFVFSHEPGYPFGNRHLGDCLDQDPVRRDRFFDLLNKYNGIAHFAGHTHVYGRTFVDGVYDVNSGMIGGYNNELQRYIYIVAQVKGESITFETYCRYYLQETNFNLIDSWTVNTLGGTMPFTSWKSITPGPGGWVSACAIDINNSNRVLVGGDVLGMAVSTDGGLTFEPSYGMPTYEIESFCLPRATYGGSTFYEFTATLGGVYESFDGGYNWMVKTAGDWPLLSESQYTRPASCIAFASGYVYTAGGSVTRTNLDSSLLGLIYRFPFNSDTQAWSLVADLKTVTGGDANIQHMVVQDMGSGVPDRIFVSMKDKGIYRSDNGGASWINTNFPAAESYVIIDRPNNPDTLYAAGGDDGMYKTTDAGQTWSLLPVTVSVQAFDLCRKTPDVLYVGSYAGPNRGVMKTTDGGTTWQNVFDAYAMPALPYSQGSTSIRYHALAVDPNNKDHVIVGSDVNLYVTFDGGATWQSSGGSTSDGGTTWTGSNFSGLCGEMIAFDPNNYDHFILGAADGGLWHTRDRGTTFTRCVTDDLGEPGVAPGEVFTDFQDGVFSYHDSNTIYMIGDLHGDAYDNSGPLFKTADAGASWNKVNDGPFNSVVIKKNDDTVVLAAGEGRIKRSSNGGQSFSDMTADIGAGRLSIDPQDTDTFYASSSGGVYRSLDGGMTWTNIGGPHVWLSWGKVAVDPTDTTIMFATAYDGFYRYDGTNWTRVLAVDKAVDITVTNDGAVYGATTSFPAQDKDIVTTGIWKSFDKGSTWFFDVEGLRVKRITTIAAHPHDPNLVIAGSDGGGFFMQAYSLASPPPPPPPPPPGSGPGPETEPEAFIPGATALMVYNNIIRSGMNQSALIRSDMKEAGRLTARIYDARGREILTLCDEERDAGRYEFFWAGQDSSGSIVGSGIYMVHMKAGEYTETRKIAVVK